MSNFKRIPGLFVEPRSKVFVRFQFNPTELKFNKHVRYDNDEIPLYHTTIPIFKGGGQQTIDFELFFDRTEASPQSGILRKSGIGVMDVQAALETFLRPADSPGLASLENLKTIVRGLTQGSERIAAPPDCLFFYGTRWYKTKMLSAPMTESYFDWKLTPLRFTTQIQLLVVEFGYLFRIRETERKVLALAGGGVSLAEASADYLRAIDSFGKGLVEGLTNTFG